MYIYISDSRGQEQYSNMYSEAGKSTQLLLELLCSSNGKESACNAGDLGSIPGLRSSLEEGNG